MKSRRATLFVSLVLLSATFLVLLMPQSRAAVYHSGTINQPETWYAADNPHIIAGDVAVANGATLTIQAGADVRFNASTNIDVSGELWAVGTPASHITFTSNLARKAAGDWGTIQINIGGLPVLSEVSYSIIKYATTGITDKRGMDITHSYITDNMVGIHTSNPGTNIELNSIVNSTTNGIEWTYSMPVAAGNIRDNNISNNGGNGVYLLQNVAPFIGDNTINGNGHGIYSVKSCPDIKGNTISGNTGIGIYAEDYTTNNVQIRDNNVITGNTDGIYALRAKMLIWDNTVSSNMQGIFLDYSPSKTENNTITSNTNFGILSEKSNQTIYNNNLTGNGVKGIRYQFWKVGVSDSTAFFQTVQDIQNNTITSDIASDGIYIKNANVTIVNNSVTWFDTTSYMGIHLEYANGTITNNSIENNTLGIWCTHSNPVVHGNNIANNGPQPGFHNDDSSIDINATYNWWNDGGGPNDDSIIGDYNDNDAGDDVSDYITYRDWLTVPAF